jgi:hypothetical protein
LARNSSMILLLKAFASSVVEPAMTGYRSLALMRPGR